MKNSTKDYIVIHLKNNNAISLFTDSTPKSSRNKIEIRKSQTVVKIFVDTLI